MRMLQYSGISRPSVSATGDPTEPSYQPQLDTGLAEYRKNAVRSMREKARDLEKKIYFTVRLSDPFNDVISVTVMV